MPSEPQDTVVTADDLPEQLRIRRDKRERLLARGEEAYPVAIERSHSLAAVHEEHPDLEAGEETQDRVAVVGRVVFVRNTGKLCFATLQDGDGTRLQAMLSLAEIGEERLAQWKEDVDLGDHIALAGRVIKSRRGELSVLAESWTMAAKALRPLPILHAELSEESRVRQRHVDLIVREGARRVVQLRAAVMASLRATFAEEDYLELETPMLQTMHGGAAARPFSTHMNAYDMELFLRIAPELFLKRALVGGLHRVFEINRNFRNEGADSTHSPEFAMLEAYQAYGDYLSIAELTRRLIQNAAMAATGSHIVELADGEQYDLGGEWTWMSMYESLSEACGQTITPETSVEHLQAMADSVDLQVDPKGISHGKLVEELWEHYCSDQLHAPTFVTDFPVETSPLTRSHRDKPGVVEKWDLYVRGFELATGYSELVDPVVQRERFEAQARAGEAGDEEAMRVDEDFLAAMEQGMPPAGGMGMGMDRLLMAITGLGIRETILFPLVKPIEG